MRQPAGANDSDPREAKAEFKDRVHRHFSELLSRGIGGNEAAALAVQLASGVVEHLVDLQLLTRKLHSPSSSVESMQQAEDMARRLFSSPETLSMSVIGALPKQASSMHTAALYSSSLPSLDENFSESRLHTPHGPFPQGRGPALLVPGAVHRPDPLQGLQEDFEAVTRFYDGLLAGNGTSRVAEVVLDGTQQMLQRFGHNSSGHHQQAGPLGPSLPLTVMLSNPLLGEPECNSWVPRVAEVAVGLPENILEDLLACWGRLSAGQLTRMIETVQQYITLHLYEAQALDPEIEAATKLLGILSQANEQSRVVPYTAFYNDAVNNDDFNIVEDYRRWRSSMQVFTFCRHSFIYDTASKSRILQLENDKQMYNEFQDAILRSWLFSATYPFLLLCVRRSPYLVHDTLQQVEGASSAGNLKKPLKVQFIGEEGVDEGGVTKEFFQLLLRDLFDPSYGMFMYDHTTRLHWFMPSQLDMEQEFRLVGIMVGLAIYNSQLLELAFPRLMYRKLVGETPCLADVEEVFPDIYNSLKQVLRYEGDVESHFGLTFQVEYEAGFGEMCSEALGDYSKDEPVTNDNRADFVELYVKNLLEDRIRSQYEAFAKVCRDAWAPSSPTVLTGLSTPCCCIVLQGFYKMCHGPVLSMFRAEELEDLICGSRLLDFEELERHTAYDDGFTRDSPTIANFWSVAHELSEEQKKLFLSFVTGSDRVPLKGLANLRPRFVISRNGPHSERLPTAHTCFNHLLLPDYTTREALQKRLLTAINNAEGFGLI